MSDTAWICDYCEEDVSCAESDEYYLWTSTHGWMCGDCREDNWNTEEDSIYRNTQ
jgi:hypothetical protein